MQLSGPQVPGYKVQAYLGYSDQPWTTGRGKEARYLGTDNGNSLSSLRLAEHLSLIHI